MPLRYLKDLNVQNFSTKQMYRCYRNGLSPIHSYNLFEFARKNGDAYRMSFDQYDSIVIVIMTMYLAVLAKFIHKLIFSASLD